MARDYDVVVIGSGAAGLAAAVTAHDEGARVLVLEADNIVGGSSRLSGGHFYAAGTSVQKASGVSDDTPDAMFSYFMTLNQWKIEPAVARRYCDLATPTFEWLRELGVVYKPERVYISGIDTVPRGHPPEGEGLAVVKVLDAERIKRNIDLALMTPAEGLVTNEEGLIAGVKAGGEEIRAPVVIIASGGFGHNKEFLAKYWPDSQMGGDWAWAISGPKAMGDGLVLGESVGGTIAGHNRGLLLLTPGFARDLEVSAAPWTMLVSREGRRFCAETVPYTVSAGLFKRNGGLGYAIFDEPLRQAAAHGPSFNADNLQARADEGRIIRAHTIKDLAAQAKINPRALEGTLEKYNADCAAGKDSSFFKDPKWLKPIATPPFYAVEIRPAIIAWTGTGLRIDPEARVIGGDERAIAGLYAAGETVGTFHGDIYIGGGGSYGPAVTFGRVAGANAAKEALASPDR
ncbi:MAG: FAD-dependent oxidoreductase [Dehalococcoidia bacterium]